MVYDLLLVHVLDGRASDASRGAHTSDSRTTTKTTARANSLSTLLKSGTSTARSPSSDLSTPRSVPSVLAKFEDENRMPSITAENLLLGLDASEHLSEKATKPGEFSEELDKSNGYDEELDKSNGYDEELDKSNGYDEELDNSNGYDEELDKYNRSDNELDKHDGFNEMLNQPDEFGEVLNKPNIHSKTLKTNSGPKGATGKCTGHNKEACNEQVIQPELPTDKMDASNEDVERTSEELDLSSEEICTSDVSSEDLDKPGGSSKILGNPVKEMNVSNDDINTSHGVRADPTTSDGQLKKLNTYVSNDESGTSDEVSADPTTSDGQLNTLNTSVSNDESGTSDEVSADPTTSDGQLNKLNTSVSNDESGTSHGVSAYPTTADGQLKKVNTPGGLGLKLNTPNTLHDDSNTSDRFSGEMDIPNDAVITADRHNTDMDETKMFNLKLNTSDGLDKILDASDDLNEKLDTFSGRNKKLETSDKLTEQTKGTRGEQMNTPGVYGITKKLSSDPDVETINTNGRNPKDSKTTQEPRYFQGYRSDTMDKKGSLEVDVRNQANSDEYLELVRYKESGKFRSCAWILILPKCGLGYHSEI